MSRLPLLITEEAPVEVQSGMTPYATLPTTLLKHR